jgi:uncharacterized repeat protein (TIGR01451 family)
MRQVIHPSAAKRNSPVTRLLRTLALLACAAVCMPGSAISANPATPIPGTIIINQASATSPTVNGGRTAAASNIVQAGVGQATGFTLMTSSSATGLPSSTVYFSHALVNNGNGSDRFTLTATQLPGDFVFSSLQIFADANGDGQPDNNIALSASTDLAAQATFRFVVAAQVPAVANAASAVSAASGVSTYARLRIDATSVQDPARTSVGANANAVIQNALTDSVTLSQGALLALSKTVSQTSAQGGDTIIYTLTARNDGTSAALRGQPITIDGVAASPLLVRDAIPANTTLAAIVTPLPVGVRALYHKAGTAEHVYASVAPTDLGEVDAIAYALAALAPAASSTLSFRVTLNANAASNGSGGISNTGYIYYSKYGTTPVQVVDSNTALIKVTPVAGVIQHYTAADYRQVTSYARLGTPLYLRADASACNASASLAEQRIVVITGPRGESESFTATESGPNTGLFTVAPVATRALTTLQAVPNNGVLELTSGDQIHIELQGCGTSIVTTMTLIDPAGTVFDSSSNAPVSGATVSLVLGDGNGGCSATRAGVRRMTNGLIEPAPSSVITGADGKYEFELTDDGNYCLLLAAPALFAFPSTVAAGQMQINRTIAATGATRGGSYGNNFSITQATGPLKIDVPLDPLKRTSLFVEKTASRSSVEIADFLDYSIKVRNNDPSNIGSDGGVLVADNLPAGFAYQRGSARINGVAAADPAGSTGARLGFNIGALNAAAVATLTYRVRIGPGALQGDATNRASASSGAATSNLASVKVAVQGGVFSNRGYIVGKVYQDCNANRAQDLAEAGIPEVRVYLEDGTYAISDGEGKYSFYGIAPRTHVLKLDQTSLPPGAQLSILSNRNAGDPGSVFVDLKNGELMKADFATASCSAQVSDEVAARRAKALSSATESQRALKQRLDADSQIRPPGDARALPASGTIGNPGNAGNLAQAGFTPLLPAPAMALGLSAQTGSASAPAAKVADNEMLETLLPTLDNSFGFIGLRDGQVLPVAQSGVRIKGVLGTLFDLSVNGEAVPPSRIGKKSTLQEKQLQAWEYIGVALKPGPNVVLARQHDQFGNLRASASITVIAPDNLERIELLLPSAAIADGRDQARIIVKLSDRHGVPVTVRTPITLEASNGRWLAADLDPVEPGLQVFVEGGRGEFTLLAPGTPGTALIRASSGPLKAEQSLDFLPDLRPMIAAGIIEGSINLRQIDSRALLPVRQQDSFEQELTRFGDATGNSAGARAALFLKGRVKGDYLLTLAYDSDKATQERLFRDISPDEFYPVYGDSAVRGFDAQSTSRLYVRIDNGKSYLLYGDYTTAGNGDARKLANYSRSLTGIKQHHESADMVSNVWASRDSTRQAVDELRANGTSGPYQLLNPQLRVNSEKVELLVRDRNQSAIVLKSVLLARFIDYDMAPLTGQLLLKMPLSSLDPDFNPQSLRVTYEVEQGGAQFWVAGFDTQVKLGERIEVGALAVHDSNPQDPVTLAGINGSVRLGEKTYVSAELARNSKESIGTGNAARIALRHDGVDLQVQAQAGRADTTFDNPGSVLARGRAEDSLKLTYRLDPITLVKMEALRTEDLVNNERRDGAYASVLRSIGDVVKIEAGVRHASASVQTLASATPTERVPAMAPTPYTSVRARVSGQLPGLPQAGLYAEYEQDIANSARKVAALGGDYQLSGAGRLYLRHEFISSLSGPYALDAAQSQNATVAGIDVDYMKDGHVFSEYRIRDALAGADTEAALGLRNTWRVAEGIALTTGFERVHTLAGSGTGEATALTFGIDYTANALWKASTRIELRHAGSGDNLLHTLGLAAKLSSEWTALARNTLVATRNNLGAARILDRMQAGLAYRDSNTNTWNGLGRIEHRVEKDDTQVAALVRRNMDLISLHANYQPRSDWTLSGRYAAKWVQDHSNNLPGDTSARLVGMRISHDINAQWDAGLIANLLAGGKSLQRGLGAEIGYQVTRNLWLSGGYNLFGFRDADLAGADHTERGAYLRLRFKFDENLFGHAPDSAMQVLR